MRKMEQKRQAILEKAADHLLAQGMKGASLRRIAAAAETSDRMLLHYFVDKTDLMTAALTLLTERLVNILERARPEPMPFESFLAQMAKMMKNPQIRPYLKISLELVALAQEKEAYRAIALRIWTDFLGWIASALKVDREADRLPLAGLAFATTEGFMLLDSLGCDKIIKNALEGLRVR